MENKTIKHRKGGIKIKMVYNFGKRAENEPKENLVEHFVIRLSTSDYKKLNRLADSLNMNASKLVRNWIKLILNKEQ